MDIKNPREMGITLKKALNNILEVDTKPLYQIELDIYEAINVKPETLRSWIRGRNKQGIKYEVPFRSLVFWLIYKGNRLNGNWLKELNNSVELGLEYPLDVQKVRELFNSIEIHYLNETYSEDDNWGEKLQEAMRTVIKKVMETEPPKHQFIHEKIKFIGRREEVSRLIEKLTRTEPYSPKVIGIYGMGGSGKTALAVELAQHSETKEKFKKIVGVEARGEYFEDGRIYQTSVPEIDIDHILNKILYEIGVERSVGKSLDEKINTMLFYSKKNPLLIILDNFEAVTDRDNIVQTLMSALSVTSRVIVTSRIWINCPSQYRCRISGLDDNDSIDLLKSDGKLKGVESVISADKPQLLQLYELCGGLPLAMKLVVSQLDMYSFAQVKRYLTEAKQFLPSGGESPNYEFYRFIYFRSWKALSKTTQEILVQMASIPSREAFLDSLYRLVEATRDVVDESLQVLVKFSLVEKSGSLQQERYKLHTITRHFLLGDIIKRWKT